MCSSYEGSGDKLVQLPVQYQLCSKDWSIKVEVQNDRICLHKAIDEAATNQS